MAYRMNHHKSLIIESFINDTIIADAKLEKPCKVSR